MRLTAVVLLALASCQTPAGSFPLPPDPAIDATTSEPPPPVVGHWSLVTDSGATEYLWIEADKNYVEGGEHISIPPLSDILTDGTWAWSSPTLTTHDARSGTRHFIVFFPGPGQMLLTDSVAWSFHLAPGDGGAD